MGNKIYELESYTAYNDKYLFKIVKDGIEKEISLSGTVISIVGLYNNKELIYKFVLYFFEKENTNKIFIDSGKAKNIDESFKDISLEGFEINNSKF